jgi:hypothetical protein
MSAATSLEQTLAAAVQDGKVPHAVVFATNRDGMLLHLKTNSTIWHPLFSTTIKRTKTKTTSPINTSS